MSPAKASQDQPADEAASDEASTASKPAASKPAASNIRFAAAASGDPGRVGKDSVPAPADGESAMIVVHAGPARQLCREAVVLPADRGQRGDCRAASAAGDEAARCVPGVARTCRIIPPAISVLGETS